jgi:hypothetical protein
MTLYDDLAPHKREIRLLRVGSNDSTGLVECDLSTHSLDEAVKLGFSALSYTWGSCQPTNPSMTSQDGKMRCNRVEMTSEGERKVLCSGVEVEITGNLLDFLKHSVLKGHPDFQGYLWIDALCINQSDKNEKSHQVNLMSQIYEKASRVFVWLGGDDESTKDAMKMILELASRHSVTSSDADSQDATTPNAGASEQQWQALSQFFARSWFRRAWIIQEAALAQECTVVCGAHTIRWETLVQASQLLATTRWSSLLKKYNKSAGIGGNSPARLAATRLAWQAQHPQSFLYALIRARPFTCHNPRDKVFSQLGLGRTTFFPNYDFSVSEVYVRAAVHIIQNADSLLILTCVEGPEFQTPDFKLPSWVPDWSKEDPVGLRVTGYEHFNAHGGRSKYARVRENNTILNVEALEIDTIEETFGTKEEIRKDPGSSSLWASISKLRTQHETAHGTHNQEEAVWRTLATNRESISPNQVAYPALNDRMSSSFTKWIKWRYAKAPSEPTTFPSSVREASILPSESALQATRQKGKADPDYLSRLGHEASHFELHYSRAMFQRPFRTKKGYFGMGAPGLCEGDSVCIVAGCRVPVVLRRRGGGDRYGLVGGAYVHGFMDGEAVGGKDERDLRFEIVSIE